MNKANDLQIDETTQAAWNGGARWYKRQSEEADYEVEKFSLIVYRLIGDYNYQWSYLHDPWWQNCPEIEPAPDWGRLVEPPQPLTDGTMAQPERVADTDKLKEAYDEGARWYKKFEGGEYQDVVFKRHGSFGEVFNFAIIETDRGLHWYLAPDNQPADDWQELVLPPPPPQPLTNDEKAVKIFNMIVDNDYAIDESYFLPRIKGIIEA